MKIYLVERTDDWCYDATDSCVVTAKSPNRAKDVAIRQCSRIGNQLKVRSIGTTNIKSEKLILESFNAG